MSILSSSSFAKKQMAIEMAALKNLPEFLNSMMPAGMATDTEFRVGDVDGNPGDSLSVCLSGDKAGLWLDHATGQKGNILGLIAAHFGIDIKTEQKAALAKAEEVLSGMNKPSPKVPPYKLSPQGKVQKALKQIAEWDYLNADNSYLWTIRRFEDAIGKKTIRPYNKKTNEYKAHPVPRPLYNLPGISQSDVVIIGEGEKVAQALIDAGHCGTTAMGGAKAPADKTDWSFLKGKIVYIVPDNDKAGAEYAKNCAKAALAAGANSCVILAVPENKPEGWDVADGLAETPPFDMKQYIDSGMFTGAMTLLALHVPRQQYVPRRV